MPEVFEKAPAGAACVIKLYQVTLPTIHPPITLLGVGDTIPTFTHITFDQLIANGTEVPIMDAVSRTKINVIFRKMKDPCKQYIYLIERGIFVADSYSRVRDKHGIKISSTAFIDCNLMTDSATWDGYTTKYDANEYKNELDNIAAKKAEANAIAAQIALEEAAEDDWTQAKHLFDTAVVLIWS